MRKCGGPWGLSSPSYCTSALKSVCIAVLFQSEGPGVHAMDVPERSNTTLMGLAGENAPMGPLYSRWIPSSIL
jgi:hypothetical protein